MDTRSTASKLEALRRVVEWKAPDRMEAPTLVDYLMSRDDPKVALLQAELMVEKATVRLLQAKNGVLEARVKELEEEVSKKGALEARIKVLELEVSKDPEVMKARREKENRERDARIAAAREKIRVDEANALKAREEAERKDPRLRRERERREREDRAWVEASDKRHGVVSPFGGQSWN